MISIHSTLNGKMDRRTQSDAVESLPKQSNSENRQQHSLATLCDWRRPNKIAIEYHDGRNTRQISYSYLNDAKKQVEKTLDSVNGKGFVGINYDVEPYCVPALILGILAQRCAFVNLQSRNCEEISSKLRIKFLFSGSLIKDWDLVCDLDVLGEGVKLLRYRDFGSEENASSDKFAYAIATSGSTGVPKIIKVPDTCIVPNILDLREILRLSSADKIAQLTSLTFDPSIVEIFLSLSSGSTMFFVSKDVARSRDRSLRSIFEHGVTFVQTTPSLWRFRWSGADIRDTILSKDSSLRILLLGGEPLPRIEDIRDLKDPQNRTKIYNIYGITEVSCWASIKDIDLNLEIDQNLGNTLSQTIFEVRNQSGDVVRDGQGILYIGSDSRICIVNDEESGSLDQTKEALVFRNTGDLVTVNGDNIFYKNRSNRVVKRFGNRVDLNELEATVLRLNFVKECLALWDEKSHKLYLCVATEDSKEPKDRFSNNLRLDEELKTQLRKLPPSYQPDRIKYLNNFRLNSSGKICRRNLMKLFQETEAQDRISNTEVARETLKGIWKNQLNSIMDDSRFLENGGNSVTAIHISNELSSALKIEFPELIGLLLANETIAECVDYVVRRVQSSIGEIGVEYSAPNRVGGHKRMKYDSSTDSNGVLCLWQKCRGRATGKVPKLNAFKASSGLKLRIEYTRDLKKCVDASPAVFEYHSGEIYVSVGSHAGVILTKQINKSDSDTWEIHLPDRIEASVLALNELKGIVGCYDGFVYCLSLKTGEIYWKFKTGETVKCTAILSDDEKSIFVGSYDKYFYNISIKDGSELWKFKGSEGSITATPCTCAKTNSVLFGTLDGTCISLNQTSGQLNWKMKFQDPIFSAPALLENGNIIFCSVSGEVDCLDSETGIKIWRYKINANVFSYPLIRKNVTLNTEEVIIGCNNKTLYCLSVPLISSAPITLKYAVAFESSIFSTPYCEGEVCIVAETGGNLNLLNVSDGKVLSSLKLNGDVFSSPIIAGGFIVVGCRDNNVYVIKIDEE